MRVTISGLRAWIVGLAVLLVLVLVAFFSYARYKAHRLIGDLPGKLGIKVVQSTDGYTLSQTGKTGKTTFTIHASKAVQYSAGAGAALHDVVITLYGAQGDRSDRISGSEFDYDQKNEIVTAKGEVQIELRGPGPAGEAGSAKGGVPAMAGKERGSGDSAATNPEAGAISVKTSGLVFNKRTEVATTTQYVEFQTPRASGHSTGATYDVEKGLLVLASAVELTSDRDGKPLVVHAGHAEFLRSSMQAFLLKASADYQAEQTAADEAIVYFRQDGSAEHIDAQGHVHSKAENGREMTAGAARILLDQHSQPQRADASKGLNFVSNPANGVVNPHQMHGNAVEGTLTFGAGGVLSHAQARDAVSFVDQQQGLAGDAGGSSTREVRAARMDVDFARDAAGHAVADKLLATGGASAVLHTLHTKGAASQNTTVKGDQLLATLRDGHAITNLHGAGHTSVTDVAASGATSVSSGDSLDVTFADSAAGAGAAPKGANGGVDVQAAQIETVVQQGNVVIQQSPAASSVAGQKAGAVTHASAQFAEYIAASQVLHLKGSPRINDGTSEVAAETIDYHRDSGAAELNGNVKTTYLQPPGDVQAGAETPGPAPASFGSEGPTHVVANSATLDQTRGQAIFRGQVHLWQGGNSIAAPTVEVSRNPQVLKASGEVTTVIATDSGPEYKSSVFRVHSRQLVYSDATRKASFAGGVVAEDASGVVHCDQAEVLLAAMNPTANQGRSRGSGSATAGNKPAQAGAGRIDRITATGHVSLQQPGRRGTGEELVYTAQDGKFILTGTSAVPPHLYDQAHGNVTGEALIFNSTDDSVKVTGGRSKAVTETRTPK